ncbi:related to nuclear distribution protein RO11 [Ustilago bromivora]|uniref:Related to nuclear distribution protein RO11 n=1 Tax=Ustilago bromivora TaxID=307758 RepID=A0A1K0H2F2_9BASI|nr:related to nuclear distribution protein RO11 [Ustilago bromivora]SYW76243.1 related to nuclear distribution protein RO11 [Ustilago bromivora]
MNDDAVDLRFDSPEQEVKHWKSKVADMQDALRETESSLQDFMESSKELETEMEKELSSSTKTISDLKRRNEQLTGDLDDWKSKYSRALQEHNATLTNLQKELAALREAVDVYKAKLRDTELTNDELENAERMIASSLADMEGKYNKTIEKTALLEEELIEKTRLEEENQRLKDELREMTEEMTVLRDVVTRSRTVSRAETQASSTYDDQPVSRSDQSFDSSPKKPSAVERPSSRQALSSPSLNRVPISRRLGAMGHNRRLSRDVRAAEGFHLAAVQDDSSTHPSTSSRTSTLARGTPSHNSTSHTNGLTSSPSARAQLRASVRAAARIHGHTGGPSTPHSAIPSNGANAAGSKRMMAEMISKMKALETRINSAKDLSRVVGPNDESAIPRPSSRMAGTVFGSPTASSSAAGIAQNSIHMPTSIPRAPRASMDGNRTIGSSIPVASRVRRPSSRMSERGTPPMPSLGLPRSQTPSGLHARGGSRGGPSPLPLEFMDHDPASTLPHVARYAAAQAALANTSVSLARRRTSMSGAGMSHSASYGSLAKVRSGTSSALPRATTPSSIAAPRVTQSTMSHYGDSSGVARTPLSTRLASSHRNGSSARGSVNGPPSSWKSSTAREMVGSGLTKSRSGSLGSQNNDLT